MKITASRFFGAVVSLLFLVPSVSFSAEKGSKEVHYEWNSPFENAKEIYVEAFAESYKGIPREILRIPNLDTFLRDEFEEETALLDETAHTIAWVTAFDGTRLIGMASFDLTNFPEEVFLRKVFVSPEYQGNGIGKALVFSILEKYPQTKKLFTITRMVNEKSILFFKALGFSHCRYLKEGYFSSQHASFIYENSLFEKGS